MPYKLNPFTNELTRVLSTDESAPGEPSFDDLQDQIDENEANITINSTAISVLQAQTQTVVTKTVDYTVKDNDCTIIADATSNTVTISLPATPITRGVYYIKCIGDAFTCDVSGNGNNIDGSSDNFQLFDDESITVMYDAVNGWSIL